MAKKKTLVEAVGEKPKVRQADKENYGLTFRKLTPQRITAYLEYLEAGATLGGAAAKIGVSDLMMRQYCKAHPEYKARAEEARLRGLEATTDRVEDALGRAARSGNVIACLSWLYNRRPHMWRDMRSLTLKSMDDVLRLIPPGLAKALRPYLDGSVRPPEGDGGK